MAYNDKDDILGEIAEEVLVQLTDDQYLGVVNDDLVAKAIARADGEVDGYCGKRYVVPFEPVPPFIKALALDITVYNLFSRRENVPENRVTRYKNAVKNLEGLAKGLVTLGLQQPVKPGETFSSATPEVLDNAGQFSRTRMKGF